MSWEIIIILAVNTSDNRASCVRSPLLRWHKLFSSTQYTDDRRPVNKKPYSAPIGNLIDDIDLCGPRREKKEKENKQIIARVNSNK